MLRSVALDASRVPVCDLGERREDEHHSVPLGRQLANSLDDLVPGSACSCVHVRARAVCACARWISRAHAPARGHARAPTPRLRTFKGSATRHAREEVTAKGFTTAHVRLHREAATAGARAPQNARGAQGGRATWQTRRRCPHTSRPQTS